MAWYAIRTVYHLGTKEDGINVFEERVVSFEAASWNEAHAKAEAESVEYAQVNEMEVHSGQRGYELDAEPLIDGYEVSGRPFNKPFSHHGRPLYV